MRKLTIFKWITKGAFVLFAFLYAVMQTAYIITAENKSIISQTLNQTDFDMVRTDTQQDTDYFKTEYESIADLTADGAGLVEEIEAGGAVLLKNDNGALPLSDPEARRVSIFGVASVDPAFGGEGSAEASNPAEPVGVREGMEGAGFTVNPALFSFYETNRKAYAPGGYKINDAPWRDLSADSKVAASFSQYGDAAIFLIRRVRGENGDLFFQSSECDGEGGNYLALNENEKSVLEGLASLKGTTFQRIIVLFNTPNQVEAAFLNDARYKIDGALWIGTVGQTGLAAVGKLLSGEVTPSGKLSDTFWNDHSDNPVMANFGVGVYANASEYRGRFPSTTGNGYTGMQYSSYVVYQEGVYVGYRYTETRYFDTVTSRPKCGSFDYRDVVAYPFGWGLSYTTFSYSDFHVGYDAASDTYTVSVTVTNTGSVNGREAVQIYLQKPYTGYDEEHGIEKPAVELVGYAKTAPLAPSARERVSVKVAGSELASFDADGAKTYILDAGEYLFTAAQNAHAAANNFLAFRGKTLADGMTEEGDKSLTSCVTLAFDDKTYSENGAITSLFDGGDINRYEHRGNNHVTYLSRSDWEGTMSEEGGMETLYLNDDMAADILAQNGNENVPDEGEMPTFGKSAGLMLIDLRTDEDGNFIDFDDPVWDLFMDQLTWNEICELVTTGLRRTGLLESVAKPATVEHNGPTGLTQQYKSGQNGLAQKYGDPDGDRSPPYYPCLGILAAAFDGELAHRFGVMLGEDALWAGYSGFYGIGINTHRSAYDGRTFEYYSEDPVLAGDQAAQVVLGIQSKGCNAYVKHIAGYEQQSNRVGLSVWCNEQAYREIYLKPFKIAVKDGGAMNAMTSYTRIGVTLCPASRALCTEFLRNECGMRGLVVSDMWKGRYVDSQLINCMMAGCDLPDSDLDGVSYYREYENNPAVAQQLRLAAKRILFATVRSNAMNGISPGTKIRRITPPWQKAVIGGTAAAGVLFALSSGMVVAYHVLAAKSKKEN